MFEMMNVVLQNRKGQGMVEYGLILALVSIFAIAALNLMAPEIANTFGKVTNALK
jgi:pilus assembly protein Flp/PilA